MSAWLSNIANVGRPVPRGTETAYIVPLWNSIDKLTFYKATSTIKMQYEINC